MKILVILMCGLWLALNAFAQEQTILLIESYHEDFEWDVSYKKGIQDILGSAYRLETFQMDTKRLPAEEHQAKADEAWAAYQRLNPALVFLGDDAALKFLGARFAETTTPVVYLGINANPRTYLPKGAKNITGVLERPLYVRSILMLKQILPLKKVLVLFDTDRTSEVILSDVFEGKTEFTTAQVQGDVKLVKGWDEWQQEVLNAKGQYDALFVGLYQTIVAQDGRHLPDSEVIAWTAANAPIPLFGFWDFAVGANKTIGGLVLSGEEHGRLAAEIALNIFAGKNPGQMQPETTRSGQLLFSRKQLEKYQLTLPPEVAAKAKFVE
ncbi:hypothetical protein U14_01150 [Candidatus Moduliflexus flocculans]|uniref:ABC-type sugar transport system, ATPase component n=1 Tax=Candidatus Moduliflexus flocculans TaxID=1499966 RepID=A0A0S6VXG6_9BACT|nr:hypothetical protein U14_01150 [Candidatus Moduliflexus flocculans]